MKEIEKNPVENWTFVCLGSLGKPYNYSKHAWVMTVDWEFKEVTFWDPRSPLKTTLEGWIKAEDVQLLANYLNPKVSSSEANKAIKKK